jgi:hypothetical protein
LCILCFITESIKIVDGMDEDDVPQESYLKLKDGSLQNLYEPFEYMRVKE